jgi:hypothetical protein
MSKDKDKVSTKATVTVNENGDKLVTIGETLVNFGKRGTIKTIFNEELATFLFYILSGHQVTLDLLAVPGLDYQNISTLGKQFVVAGVRNKILQSVSGKDASFFNEAEEEVFELYNGVAVAAKAIQEGKVVFRAGGAEDDSITDEVRLFALYRSFPGSVHEDESLRHLITVKTVNNQDYYFPALDVDDSEYQSSAELWNNIMNKKERNVVRKSPYFKMFAGQQEKLDAATVLAELMA